MHAILYNLNLIEYKSEIEYMKSLEILVNGGSPCIMPPLTHVMSVYLAFMALKSFQDRWMVTFNYCKCAYTSRFLQPSYRSHVRQYRIDWCKSYSTFDGTMRVL